MVSGSSRPTQAGMTPWRGLWIWATIVLLGAAVLPDRVGECRAAELRHALALLAVACRALLGEDRGTARRGFGILGAAGEREHVLGDVADLASGQHVERAERRHLV